MDEWPCRLVSPNDVMAVQALCASAQATYWPDAGKPLREWTEDIRQQVTARWSTMVATDPVTPSYIIGALIMSFRYEPPPTEVHIAALVSSDTLTEDERVGVYLSLLIAGHPVCMARDIERGYGFVVVPNAPVLRALELTGEFGITVFEYAEDGVTPSIYRADLPAIDRQVLNSFRAALRSL